MTQSDNNDRGMTGSTFLAALFGAIAGGIAVYLADRENRQKVRNTVNRMMEEGDRKLNEAGDKMEDIKSKGKRKLAEKLDQAKNKLEEEEEKTMSE